MSQLAPHLLLRADTAASHAATLLRAAGYRVSKVNDDTMFERIAESPEIDGVIVELSALAAVAIARRIEAKRRDLIIVVLSAEADAVRRALPAVRVMRAEDVDDDLVSTIDLALAGQQMRQAG
jgi:DNA-binding response OmpR family regulator